MSAETFKDPAAQMKRALFRSLAIGAVAVVLYMFCVEPCQSSFLCLFLRIYKYLYVIKIS